MNMVCEMDVIEVIMALKVPFQHFPEENQSQDGLKPPNI
jgi:hypothetical protein